MPSLESDKVKRALKKKLKAREENSFDWFYFIDDDEGTEIAYTRLSKGPKETLGTNRVSQMAAQLRLDNAVALVNLVQCPLSREDALAMMKRNPTDASKFR